jgi:putative ABC transport system permease protein
MLGLYCRLLLLAFPRRVRDRIGRPLVQTLVSDCRHASGRVSIARVLANSGDVVRAGLAERMAKRQRGTDDVEPGKVRRRILTDLGHARRSLRRRPAFTLTVFGILALGLGLNTAVFSVVHRVLVTELPYRDPSRLAFMWTTLAWIGVPRAWVAGPHIDRLRHEAGTIEEIIPLRTEEMQLTGAGAPELVRAGLTSARLFDVLGTRPLYGRTFVLDDEPRNVVILGHALWTQRFGASPDVIGRTVEVGGDRMEIVGVLPADFRFLVHASLGGPREVDLWLPVQWPLARMDDRTMSFAALVRVRPQHTLAQAQAELNAIGGRLDRERYKSRGFGWQLVGVQDDLVKDARPALLLILGASAALLLVVAANIAGLLLVRHADRRREFGVRAALGARRGDLVRLVIVECVALSVAAGAAGVVLAWGLLRLIVAWRALPVPRLSEIGVDGTVLAFSFALALVTGLAASAIPAWRSTRRGISASLADAIRGSSGRISRIRGGLVAAELALAVVLLTGCALLVRSYTAIRAVDPGFDGSGTITAEIQLTPQRYPQASQAVAFFERLTEHVRGLPDVTAAGAANSAPLGGDADQAWAQPSDWVPPPGASTSIMVDIIRATPGYFAAMGIPMSAGRDFTWRDRANAALVAVVDEAYVRQAWPDGRALGRTVKMDDAVITVIGVVRHARLYRIERDDRPQIYRPYAQDVVSGLTLAVRTASDPERLPDVIRRAVWSIDDKQPVGAFITMRHAIDETLSGRRLQLEAVSAFAIGAAVLAALGLYGLLAAAVHERRREIGIRMALGADRAAVGRLLGSRLLLICGAGCGAGLIAAVWMSRSMTPLLYGVGPLDPLAFGATMVALVALVVVASYVPVRRATSLDPAESLRTER